MTLQKRLALALGVFLPMALLFFVILKPRKQGSGAGGAAQDASAAAPAGAAPADPVHEMASLEEQRKQNPNHAPILIRMAELKKQGGDGAEALKLLQEAAKTEPGNAEIQLELGKALFESNDPQGAIQATSRILEKDKNHVDALYNLGAIYGNMGDDAKAHEYFTRAAEANPTSDSGMKAKAALVQLRTAGGNSGTGASGTKEKPFPLPLPGGGSTMDRGAMPPNHPPLPAGHPPTGTK